MTTRYGEPTACEHQQWRCLRSGNTGCDTRDCLAQGYHAGLCRHCGHIEKVAR
jgi:hypothetical protein